MIEFYHDPGSQAVYAVPARPNVIETRYGWKVQVAWEVTRADNCVDPKTNRLRFPRSVLVKDFYSNSSDTEQKAVEAFKLQNYPPGHKIDAAEYAKLKQVYDAQAKQRCSNPPGKAR